MLNTQKLYGHVVGYYSHKTKNGKAYDSIIVYNCKNIPSNDVGNYEEHSAVKLQTFMKKHESNMYRGQPIYESKITVPAIVLNGEVISGQKSVHAEQTKHPGSNKGDLVLSKDDLKMRKPKWIPPPQKQNKSTLSPSNSTYHPYKSVQLYGHLIGHYLEQTSKPQTADVIVAFYPCDSRYGVDTQRLMFRRADTSLKDFIRGRCNQNRLYKGKPIYQEIQPNGGNALSVEVGDDNIKDIVRWTRRVRRETPPLLKQFHDKTFCYQAYPDNQEDDQQAVFGNLLNDLCASSDQE